MEFAGQFFLGEALAAALDFLELFDREGGFFPGGLGRLNREAGRVGRVWSLFQACFDFGRAAGARGSAEKDDEGVAVIVELDRRCFADADRLLVRADPVKMSFAVRVQLFVADHDVVLGVGSRELDLDDRGRVAVVADLDLAAWKCAHARRGRFRRQHRERCRDAFVGRFFEVCRDQAFARGAGRPAPDRDRRVAVVVELDLRDRGTFDGLVRVCSVSYRRPAEPVVTAIVELLGADFDRLLSEDRFALDFDHIGDA